MPSSRSGKRGSVTKEMLAFDPELIAVNAVETYIITKEAEEPGGAPKIHNQTTSAAQWIVSNPLGYIPTSFLAFNDLGERVVGVYLPGTSTEEFIYDVGEAMTGTLYFK